MRIKFFLLLLVLILLVFVGELLISDPGYLLLSYGQTVVETSLLVGSMLGLLFLVVFSLSLLVLAKLLGFKTDVNRWLTVRHVKNARQKTTLGLIELAEGHWSKARALLDESAADHDHPLINYLNAARAADEQGEIKARDEYLRLAHETKTGNPDFAVGLTQAQLHFQRKDWERCLATLERLHKKSPKHGYVLKMLSQVYQEIEAWEQLAELLPKLRKSKESVYTPEELKVIERRCYQQWLKSVLKRKLAKSDQSEQLERIWRKLPRSLRQEPETIYVYCDCSVQTGSLDRAVEQLESALSKEWSDKLADLYGSLPISQPEEAIQSIKSWLRDRPTNPSALLALGRMLMRNQQWDEAKACFENCLSAKQSAEVYGELGRLLASQQQHEQSNEYFKKGLAMLVDGLPDLPLPKVAAAMENVSTPVSNSNQPLSSL